MNFSAQEEAAFRADLVLLSRPEIESVFYVVHTLAEDHRADNTGCLVCDPAGQWD